jgi:hypothetical protein
VTTAACRRARATGGSSGWCLMRAGSSDGGEQRSQRAVLLGCVRVKRVGGAPRCHGSGLASWCTLHLVRRRGGLASIPCPHCQLCLPGGLSCMGWVGHPRRPLAADDRQGTLRVRRPTLLRLYGSERAWVICATTWSISGSPITTMARAARSGRGCPSVADQRSEGAQPTTDRSPGSGPGRPRADPSSGPARALTQWRSSRLATPRRLALFPSPVSPGPDGR